jgi:hypothetical protein
VAVHCKGLFLLYVLSIPSSWFLVKFSTSVFNPQLFCCLLSDQVLRTESLKLGLWIWRWLFGVLPSCDNYEPNYENVVLVNRAVHFSVESKACIRKWHGCSQIHSASLLQSLLGDFFHGNLHSQHRLGAEKLGIFHRHSDCSFELVRTSRLLQNDKLRCFFWTEVQFYLTWPVHPQAWEPILVMSPFFAVNRE